MGTSEQVESLIAEKKHLLEFIETINAEKIALDQMLVESLKSSVSAKKELWLANSKITTLSNENSNLKSQNEQLQKSFDDYKSKYGYPTDGILLEG